jgi:pentatricopeptide repeat protein
MLISAYSKLGKAEIVKTLSDEAITGMRGSLDASLFNSILKSYCTLGLKDAIMDTLKRMSHESVSPDRATFNILIFYFCQEKMFDIALQTFNDLKFRKFRPNFVGVMIYPNA